MIRGSDVLVEPAGDDNNFIELPPEVKHPWAKLGKY